MNQKPESMFNAGIAKLWRIDRIKQQCHIARWERNLNHWFECLLSYRSELGERLNKEEAHIVEAYVIYSYQQKARWNRAIRLQSEGVKARIPMGFYHELDQFERYLSSLEHKYGLSLPDKQMESMLDT